jgi:hypothetical protein
MEINARIRIAHHDLVIWLGRMNQAIPTLAEFASLSQSEQTKLWESVRTQYVRYRAEHKWQEMNAKLRSK